MQSTDDSALLRNYVENNSEDAFAALVTRHVSLVYSVAMRSVGNPAAAEEITQAVFIILARKAGQLRSEKALSSWLFQTTRLTANNFLRTELRRQHRETEAHNMQTILNEPEPELWPRIAPLLDNAVAALNEKDRRAILLRFYEGKNLREIGTVLGASEAAAEKRVSRAMEKLRKFFFKRGVTSTANAITETISVNSVQAAPVALVKTISAVAIAKGAAASGSTLTLVKGALKIMAWTKAQTAIVSIVIVGMATYSVIQHQEQSKLREQNESLQQQIAQTKSPPKAIQTPHLPAPQMQMAASTAVLPEVLQTTNLYSRLKDKSPKLTPEQIDAYLKANGRTAANLLAAFRTSGDPALLKEAMGKFPNDPQVAFEAATDKDLSPAEQRQWLDAFEKSAPNNSLANYLSALNYFNSGQIDQGVQELSTASGKQFQDYDLDHYESDEEAFLAAGYSEADAKALASNQLLLPQLAQMKQLGLDAVDLASAYRQAGDTDSAQTVLQMAASMGQNYVNSSAGEPMVSQLVGIAIERLTLNAMDPNSSFGNNGQTVQDELNLLAQQNAALHLLDQQFAPLQQMMSDQDWINYKDRYAAFGEAAAEQWVVNKYGQQ